MPPIIKRQRPSKAQIELLISLVEKDKFLQVKITSLDTVASWEAAALKLNKAGGTTKDGPAWQESWKALIKRTREAMRKTGDFGNATLSSLHQRVLTIMASAQAEEDSSFAEKIDCNVDVFKAESDSYNESILTTDRIKSEPFQDWTPDQQKHIPSYHGMDDLVVTVRSTDLMNLVPVKSVTGDVIFSCGTCTYHNIFKTSEHLIIHHFREHSDKYQVRCNKCNIILGNNNILNHVKYHFDAQDDEVNGASNVESDNPGFCQSLFLETEGTFVCDFCKLEFVEKKYLEEHIITTHQDPFTERNSEMDVPLLLLKKRHKCHICPKSFPQKSFLQAHILSHNRRFKCNLCSKAFTTKQTLNIHLDWHAGKKFPCEICKKDFSQTKNLVRHMKIHHFVEESKDSQMDNPPPSKSDIGSYTKRFKCNLCSKAFTTKQTLNIHLDWHSGNKYPCEICGLEFSPAISLTRHMKSKHSMKERKKHLCQFCGKSFLRAESYRFHLITHNEGAQFRCEHCPNKSFTRRIMLTRHMRRHIEGKNYLCPKCGEAFQLPSLLAYHLRKIHKNVEEFECTVCSLKFNKHQLLLEHLKEHPDNPRPFQCSFCSKAFAHANVLRKHSLRAHTENRTKAYKCHLCPKSFPESYGLKTHIASHTKPFKCSICLKAFARETMYKQHLEWHSGKRFPCEVCGKEFASSKTLLLDHMNLHTGLTPYQCLICEERFSLMNKYYYHLSNAHN